MPGHTSESETPSKHKLKQLEITEVALVPEGANQEAHIVLFKAKKGGDMPKIKGSEIEVLKKEIEELTKSLTDKTKSLNEAGKLEKQHKDEVEKLSKQYKDEIEKLKTEKAAEQKPKDDVLKGLSEDAKTLIEKMNADLFAAAEAVKKSNVQIAKLQSDAKETKIRSQLEKHSGAIDIDIVTKALMTADDNTEKAITDLIAKLNASNSLLIGGGAAAADMLSSDDSFAKAKTLAKEFRNADSSLTDAQAMSKVWLDNPELYNSVIEN